MHCRAFASGRLSRAQGERAQARLDRLAQAYPSAQGDYAAAQREVDEKLMHRAWSEGLLALRGAQAPGRNTPLRVIVQDDVPTDMVSEAGPTALQALALFDGFTDVKRLVLDDIDTLRWEQVPQDGRFNVLVSTRRHRYETAVDWQPDLHLALWNPFLTLDVPGPALLTWGTPRAR